MTTRTVSPSAVSLSQPASVFFKEFDVETFFDSRAPCNILSFGELAKIHRIEFSPEDNCFTVFKYPYKYAFDNLDGVYTRDFSVQPSYQMYRTVQDAMSLFSKRAVELARGVRELMHARGVTSPQEMIRTLEAGAIEGCKFLPEHVRLADKIFGPDIASLRGKSKRRKPLPAPDTSFKVMPVRQLQWLYVDLFLNLWSYISNIGVKAFGFS